MSSAADREMILIWNPEFFWVCWNILHILKTIMGFLESTKFKSSLFFKENYENFFCIEKLQVFHICWCVPYKTARYYKPVLFNLLFLAYHYHEQNVYANHQLLQILNPYSLHFSGFNFINT